jgi:hypothetical protein
MMVRDPYATLEGIVRRWARLEAFDPAELPTVAARHLVTCFERQRENRRRFADSGIFFTYEDLCENPEATAQRIGELVPELGDLDLTQRLSVKGSYDEELRNMNAEQIARLSDAQLAGANTVFREHEALLTAFGYAIRN